MNRKQRRAAVKQSPPGQAKRAGDTAGQLFAEAERLQQQNKLNDAVRVYKRLLLLNPGHAQAHNNLGVVLLAQGKRAEASACFAQALTLMPQMFEQFGSVCETLAVVLPPIGEAMRRAVVASPNRLTADQLLDDGLAAICADPMLLCTLQSVSIRKSGLELVLTGLRAALLAGAGRAQDDGVLAFGCAMANQCFINEYVFAVTPDEDTQVERLKADLAAAIATGAAIAPMRLAALAMFLPLHVLPGADTLLALSWPPALDDVLTQQLREPIAELALRPTIARLTTIDDVVSLRVQRQYEENPYPRWVRVHGNIEPVALDRHLRNKFPTAAFTPLGKTENLEILVAGCGTGWQSTGVLQTYLGAQVLAVDLSLSSLCFAKRMTPSAFSGRIEYLQGDILKLGSIGRSFDMIDVTGVLHHMADPLEGWRILLTLLRPRGIMHLGFYSELGRRDLAAACAFIAERGYGATAADIRRCRQDLLNSPMAGVARFTDFFSTSECRDLLFHVHENRMTIPAIKAFIDGHAIKFIGFDLDDAATRNFRAMFAAKGWSMSDLDKWHAVETQYPDTFSGMYQFWVQKG